MDATRWTLRGLSLGMLGVLLTALPAPGIADTRVFDDPVGDSTSVDISRVRVVHRDSVTVRVRSVVPLAAGQVYAFWIDTGPRPRPNYHVSFRANSGFDDSLGLVPSFGDRPTRFVRCRGMRARADIFSDAPVSLRIPRRCLQDPRKVRVAVRFEDETTGTTDWAPDRRTFGPWVRR
jgi:hypothetical protein